MTDKLYLITAQKIAELIANAKDYNAEKIAMLLQSLPMVDGEPCGFVRFDADGTTPLGISDFQDEFVYKSPVYTSPQALTTITADDVTDEMVETISTYRGDVSTDKLIIAAAYNAVIKHRSEA